MFEFSVAFKYLTPRWRQLSVSIISIISILVISLVVWLIVVFFSVTQGLEKSWIQKLIALTAPVRIIPTEEYYNSYYYHVDSISSDSDYSLKTIGEKLKAPQTDPYNPSHDEEAPSIWAAPIRNPDGSLKDLAKIAYNLASELKNVPGLVVQDYALTVGNLRLHIVRDLPNGDQSENYLNQAAYLGPFDPTNSLLMQTLIPNTKADENNALHNIPKKSLNNLSMKDGIPSIPRHGDGIIVPKGFREAGAMLGDPGHISYFAPTTSSVQEQRLPVYVAGFYDPGIMPLGGKYILVNPDVINLVRTPHQSSDQAFTNGINIRFNDINQAEAVKAELEASFKREGIDKYWRIETYSEYEFTKDLIQQLRSERNLWTLISMVVIIVACSNIISMLIILVNDKKLEIGILRSMGASSISIAIIFGLCGVVMGMVGSIIGTLVAVLTLHNLQALVEFIGRIQGYDMFNSHFYGEILPNTVSIEALLFVIVATSFISLIAGIVPALKAGMIRPSTILRSE
jgi:ABC-type lipoprotein release transport system permease subunit